MHFSLFAVLKLNTNIILLSAHARAWQPCLPYVSLLHEIFRYDQLNSTHLHRNSHFPQLYSQKVHFFHWMCFWVFRLSIKYNMQFVLITSTNQFELCTGVSVINPCNTYQTIQQTRHTIARRNFIKSWLREPAIIQRHTLISWVSEWCKENF